jgi:hypothetical protein
MKQVEDRFQPLADRIACGELIDIPEESAHDVNPFFSLWLHRSRIPPAEEIETQLNGPSGNTFTRDEQEILESKQGEGQRCFLTRSTTFQ